MMRRRLAAALALVVGAALPLPGAATDIGPGCGQADPVAISVHDCKFLFRGLPIQVTGTATDPDGNRNMTLRVWVHEYYEHEHVTPVTGHATVITECTTQGRGFIICAEEWPTGDEIDLIHPLLTQQVHLSCHVEASITGTSTKPRVTYSCKSGRGF